MSNRSRLSRKLESKTKQSIFFTLLGTIIVLGLIAKFGIPVLANVSFFLFEKKDTQDQTSKNKSVFVSPPELDALPSATNSATITISGTAQENQEVALYLNGELEEKTDAKDSKRFTFTNIKLKEGENLIQTKAIQKDAVSDKDKSQKEQTSDYSKSYIIILTKKEPTLTIDSPSDKQTFGKDDKFANVTGSTDIENKVTVNDFWAIVDNDGKYSYSLPLKGGENKITVKTTDDANNETKKEITVTYNQ